MSCLLFKALIRDGFRCVISGLYDFNSVKDNKELEQLKVEGAANADKCTMQCAHILPESTMRRYLVAMRRMIRFFFPTYLDVFLSIYRHLNIG